MAKKLFWLFLLLLLPTLASAQGSRFDSTAQKTVQNFIAPIPGAIIVVCTSAGTGTPCSPTAPIYTDAGLTQLIPGSTFTADSNGNFGFFASPGTYKYSITATGVTGQLYTIVLPINLASSNAFTGNNTHSGTETFTGAVVAPAIGPSAAQQHTLPSVASDTIALLAATQALTNKTLTSPTSTGTDNGTETLANKTLTAPVINALNLPSSGITLLNGQSNVGPITGNSSAQTVYTYTLPANTVASLKVIRINLSYQHAGSASVAFATTFNGITMQSWSSTAAQGLEHLTLINTGSASCAIEGFAMVNTPAVAAAGAGNVASGLSWASGQVINFTFNVANTDTVTGMQFVVELIQ